MATPLSLAGYHQKFFIRGVKSIQLMPRTRTVAEYARRMEQDLQEVESYARLCGLDEIQALKKLQGLAFWGQLFMFTLSTTAILCCLALGVNELDAAAAILAFVPLVLFIAAAYLPD